MHALRVRMRTVGWTALFTGNGLTEGKGRHERAAQGNDGDEGLVYRVAAE